ncbi:DNA-methyltransferase [Helicobacter felis]|uniref:Methyltransferase n=1 Tax=Helicobacter felis (strain ATCC 49179 / CCUG 28539 / NCTC 12436 / CS1) TaxID=936155 RepID=E7A932_HELFC|nr:site-specific DNA-methyltransferase [Helicobacter felis]CBY83259.1 DNA methylase N-4/N-6 domain [Helicobacter felis ATCC 49179]
MLEPVFVSLDQKFKLYHADCKEVLPHLQGQVDLIFADPPYFLSNGGLSIQSGQIVSVDKGAWDKSQGLEHMHAFNMEWLGLAKDALKPTGSLFISATYHNLFSLGLALQSLGFKLINLITWHKSNPPPNFSCRTLVHASEQILWARKSPKHAHIFNYEHMKALNENKQMRDVWTLPAIAPWEKKLGKHPTQKPLSLLTRLIVMASQQESLICDPFSGSGSTGIAANLLGRSFVGIEREQEFIELATKRKLDLDESFEEYYKKLKLC